MKLRAYNFSTKILSGNFKIITWFKKSSRDKAVLLSARPLAATGSHHLLRQYYSLTFVQLTGSLAQNVPHHSCGDVSLCLFLQTTLTWYAWEKIVATTTSGIEFRNLFCFITMLFLQVKPSTLKCRKVKLEVS